MNLEDQLKFATQSVPVTEPTTVVGIPTVQATQVPVQPVTPVATTSVGPIGNVGTEPVTPVAPATYVAPVAQPTINLEEAQKQAETSYAVQTIEIGQKISNRAIDPVKKLDKGEQLRLTVLNTTDWQAVKVHNHPDLGKIICWGGKCCSDSLPRVRYAIPVMVYSTLPNDINVPVPQGKSELKLLVLWDAESYDSLCQCIINAGNDITSIDLQAKAIDNYGKLMFYPVPSFRNQFANELKVAEEKWALVKDKALDTVGRKLDDERYSKLTMTAVPPQMQTYNMSDIAMDE